MNLIPACIYRCIAHRPNLVKIVDNIGWLFFDKILRMGVGLIVGAWVARYLGPEQFGLLNFALAFMGLFSVLATQGLQETVVRDIVLDPNYKEDVLGTAAVIQMFGGVVAYGFILSTIFWLRPHDALAKGVVAVLGLTMLLKFSDVAVYWFESQLLSKYTVWVQNGSFLVFATIKVILILKSASLMAFVWATLAEAVAAAILMLATLNWRGLKLRCLRVSWFQVRRLLSNSWPLMLSGIAVMAYVKVDQIMLGKMIGDEAVGIYSVAARVSEVWYFIPMTITASVFPSILKAKKHDEVRYYQHLQKLYNLMVLLSVSIALPMTFLSTSVITFLFGSDFIDAGPVLSIHIWASIFVFLGVVSGQWFLAENRQLLSLRRTVLGAIMNVMLNFWLIPSHGVMGAAIATVLSYSLAAFFSDLFQNETRNMFFMKLKAMNLFLFFKEL